MASNLSRLQQARAAWQTGDAERTRQCLLAFQLPDDIFAWEWEYLSAVSSLAAAEQAASQGRTVYARQLLEEAESFDHGIPELERRRILLLGRISGTKLPEITARLPSLDEELLLRAEAALAQRNPERAIELLRAVEDPADPRRNLLMGEAWMQKKKYRAAAECLEKAEGTYQQRCLPLLELCFRELGDFRKAYEYACKRR